MDRMDDVCGRLARRAAGLSGEIEARLGELRSALRAGNGDAELELASILRRLDEVNEAAGDCLAAVQDARR